jgi:hypothetical protein
MPFPGFWKEWKSGREGGRLLGWALPPLLSPLFPLLGVGLLLCCVEAAVTTGSWPPRASHWVSAAFTMAAAVPWAPAPTVSLMDGGRRIKNIARKRSLSGDTPGGRCCLSFKAIQSKTAICTFQTVQAKWFSKTQTAHLSCCRRQGCHHSVEALCDNSKT